MKVLGGFLITIFLAAMVYSHVWQRVQIIKLGYEIARQEEQKEELMKQRRLLRLEYSRIGSVERLGGAASREFARSQLGNIEVVELVMPRSSLVIEKD